MKIFNEKSKSVFYQKSNNVFLELKKNHIGFLKAKNSMLNKKSRICVHKNENSKLHQMLIFHQKGAYVRPHKHLFRSELFFLIQGKLKVLIFNNKGNIKKLIEMSDFKNNEVFLYKMNKSIYHTFLIEKDCLFLETTSGPFNKKDSIYAKWSPEEKEYSEVKIFLKYLKKMCSKFE